MSDMLEIGSIISGTVINIKPYGIFVSIGNNQKGLVHISQVSDEYIKDINQILKSGDKINVKVLSNEEGKISLSIKDVPKDQLVLETKKNEMKRDYHKHNATIEVTHKCLANKEKMADNRSKTFDELMKDFNRQSNDKVVDINKRLKNRY